MELKGRQVVTSVSSPISPAWNVSAVRKPLGKPNIFVGAAATFRACILAYISVLGYKDYNWVERLSLGAGIEGVEAAALWVDRDANRAAAEV